MAWERGGVPGGQAGTSWFDRDVAGMWRVVENQQSDDHWRLVAGWRKASELTSAHMRRLAEYRDRLAEVWPPDRNAAAAAYVARLDFLIQNVAATHEVAAANYSTLAATVGALASARRELKPIYDEYVGKVQAIKEYEERVAFSVGAEGVTTLGVAPATRQDLERLNIRARAIMYDLSHTLVEAKSAIQQPPTYQSGTYRAPGDPDVYGNAAKAPPSSESLTPRSIAPSVDVKYGAGEPDSGHGVGGSSTWGARPSNGHPMPAPSPTLPAKGGSHVLEPGRLPAALTEEIAKTSEQPSGRGSPSQSGARRGSLSQPLSPGGIIGATPVVDQSRISREAARPNPVGGVIGSQRPTTTTSHMNGAQPVYGTLGGHPTERQHQRAASPHPDTVWDVAEGVPPVIAPSREIARFDPGPAIGLDQ